MFLPTIHWSDCDDRSSHPMQTIKLLIYTSPRLSKADSESLKDEGEYLGDWWDRKCQISILVVITKQNMFFSIQPFLKMIFVEYDFFSSHIWTFACTYFYLPPLAWLPRVTTMTSLSGASVIHINSLVASGYFPFLANFLGSCFLMKYFPPISPCNENISPEFHDSMHISFNRN